MRLIRNVFWAVVLILAAPAAALEFPDVTVRPMAEGGWQVDYRLPAPVDRLVFYRPNNPLVQEEFWELRTPGLVGSIEGENYVLRRTDGSGLSEVSYFIPNYRFFIEKDYFDAFRFSDGGQLLYTGHIAAFGVAEGEQPSLGDLIPGWTMQAHAPEGGRIVTTAGTAVGEKTLYLGYNDGTYLYFGHASPVENDFMAAIIDPGAPDWLRAPMEEFLPALAEYYYEKLGKRLSYRPLTFLSVNLGECPGRNSKAGTLSGLLQIDITCTGWRAPNEYLFWLLAHETAHFWNGQMFAHDNANLSYWMSEGGASYFAQVALLDLGLVDTERFLEWVDDAGENCLNGLDGITLAEAGSAGRFGLYYDCGAWLHYASDVMLERTGSKADTYDIWAAMLERATFHDNVYTQDFYFEELAQQGVTDSDVDLLRKAVAGGLTEFEALQSRLRD